MDFNNAIQEFITKAVYFIPNLIAAIVIFILTLMISSFVVSALKKVLQAHQVDEELIVLLSRISRWSVLVVGTIWALEKVHFNVTGFVAGLGIVGFTIGFALKDVAENFVAGILLLIQQPFDIGDAIEVAGYAGTVTDIKVRDTTLRSWEGLLVIIPNAKVYTQVITNYSRLEKRRLSLEITVDYETDLSTAQNTILEVVTQLPGIITDTPAPTLVFNEFADNGIKATLYYWYDAQKTSYWTALDDAVKGIKTALEQADIHIPRGTYILQSPSPPLDHSTDSLDESP